jgi:hypothetical protein
MSRRRRRWRHDRRGAGLIQPVRHPFGIHDRLWRDPVGDYGKAVAIDQHFGNKAARVVARRHGRPIGPSGPEHGEVAACHVIDSATVREGVARFADWADDVGSHPFASGPHRVEVVPSTIQCRARQIVHRRVHDNEWMLHPALYPHDPGQQDTGVADDDAARFKD